jgi:hypothetical protein
LNFEGQGQARLHLKSKLLWSYEWGPVQNSPADMRDKRKRVVDRLDEHRQWACETIGTAVRQPL